MIMNPSLSYNPHESYEQPQRINNNNNIFNSNSTATSTIQSKTYSLDFSIQNNSNNNQCNNSHDLFNSNSSNSNKNNNNNQQQGSRYTYTYEKGRPNPPLHSSTSTSSLHQASYPPISPFTAQSHQSQPIQPIMSFPPLYRDQPSHQQQQQLVQQQQQPSHQQQQPLVQQQQQLQHNSNIPHSPTYSLNQPPPQPQAQPALYTYTQSNLHSNNNTTTNNTSRTGTDLNSPRFKKGSVHFSSVYKKDSLIGGCAWWIADETGKTISSGAVPVNQDYPNPYRLEFKAMFHALNAANVAGIRIPTIKGTNLFALTFLSSTTTSSITTSTSTNQHPLASSEQHTQPSEFLPFLSTIYHSIRDLIEPIRRAMKRFIKYNIELLPINKNIFAHRLATQSMDKSIRRKLNITTYIENIKNNKDVIYSNSNVYDNSIYDNSIYDNNISGSNDTYTPPYNTTGTTGRSSLAS